MFNRHFFKHHSRISRSNQYRPILSEQTRPDICKNTGPKLNAHGIRFSDSSLYPTPIISERDGARQLQVTDVVSHERRAFQLRINIKLRRAEKDLFVRIDIVTQLGKRTDRRDDSSLQAQATHGFRIKRLGISGVATLNVHIRRHDVDIDTRVA